MAKNIRSFADLMTDWEGLLTAARDNAVNLPSAEAHRLALEQAFAEVKALKALQDARKAGKQKATQDLKALLKRGRDLASRLRGAVTADLGPTNEQLVGFGISPTRRPRRAPVFAKQPPPPLPPAAAPSTNDPTP
jgi:hypothetical protein